MLNAHVDKDVDGAGDEEERDEGVGVDTPGGTTCKVTKDLDKEGAFDDDGGGGVDEDDFVKYDGDDLSKQGGWG